MFTIVEVDNVSRKSSPGRAEIYNISPGGLKMYTKYDLSLKKYNIKIDIMFQLIGRSFSFSGTPVWQIEGHDSGYYYGIDLDIDDHTQKDLIERIKQHSASSSK